MYFVRVTSEMLYFKWFLVLKLGNVILLDLAVSKFIDLIFTLFLPERLKLRNSIAGNCNYYSLLATTAIKFTIPWVCKICRIYHFHSEQPFNNSPLSHLELHIPVDIKPRDFPKYSCLSIILAKIIAAFCLKNYRILTVLAAELFGNEVPAGGGGGIQEVEANLAKVRCCFPV